MELNQTWLHGEWDGLAVIDTALPTILIYDFWSDGSELFLQGDEANSALTEIHQIWLDYDCSIPDAILRWVNLNSN